MSLGDADAKFPGQVGHAIPPSPSRENPGQVYPKSDPKAAAPESIPGTGGKHEPLLMNTLGNPFEFESAIDDLDRSLSNIISIIDREERSAGSSADSGMLLQKFTLWKEELERVRGGRGATDHDRAKLEPEGGLFID